MEPNQLVLHRPPNGPGGDDHSLLSRTRSLGCAAHPGQRPYPYWSHRHRHRPASTRLILLHYPQARRLVTQGLYSKIRNPIYFFGLILFAGLRLAIHRGDLWIILPIALVLQLIRARREAKVLETAFGENYQAYRRQTWF